MRGVAREFFGRLKSPALRAATIENKPALVVLITLAVWIILQAYAAPAYAQDLAIPPAAVETVVPPSAPIPLHSPDGEIRGRLVGLYSQVDGLKAVQVVVHNGVVTLKGTTLEVEDSSKAEDIASRVAGVVSVQNELTAEHRVDRRLLPLIERSREIGGDLISFLPLLLVAALAFIGFWLLGRVVTRSTRLFKRLAPNQFIEMLLEQVVRFVFIVLGLVVAMSVLGATALIGSVLGAAGVLGLAIGFAVRDTIENYIASILLSVRRPFAPNDVVNIEGFEGRVARLNSRATILILADGSQARIPNATVYKANIVNLSHAPDRRLDFEIGIGFENDISCALAVALNAVKAVEGVLSDPLPLSLVDRIEAHAVVIKIMGWVDQSKSDFGKVKSEAIRAAKEALDAEHISIPEPIFNMRKLAEFPEVDRSGQATRPTKQDRETIKDTSADSTITEKVEAVRSSSAEDLLTHSAPRE